MIRSRQHVPSSEEQELRQAVQSRPFPRRKKVPKKKTSWVPLLLSLVFLSLLLLWVFLTTSLLSKDDSQANNDGPPQQRIDFLRKPTNKGLEATVDQVVLTLLQLAHMPIQDLQKLLEGDDSSSSPFQLDKLQEGICPWTSFNTIPWLPTKKSPERSRRLQTDENKNAPNKKPSDNQPVVAIYYEHLSKAGGTSFCKLAQSNMVKKLVPGYYCMPSKPDAPDARVGAWPTQELEDYFLQKNHRLVSNEWEPFNLEYQKYFSPETNDKVQLVFVTSIRNPINRLMSAHKFWGILHNGAKVKPTLEQWLTRYARRAKRWKVMDGDFTANVGRFNFGTWKFSGGSLPVSDMNLQAENLLTTSMSLEEFQDKSLTEDQWRQPFETAVRALAQFDLVIPMEELSKHPQPVTEILGWNDFSQAHVVPSGKVVNNKASSELPPQEYDLLWQSNALDMILYYWSLAVYLTRLHCGDLLK
jgi:hypothetical protein